MGAWQTRDTVLGGGGGGVHKIENIDSDDETTSSMLPKTNSQTRTFNNRDRLTKTKSKTKMNQNEEEEEEEYDYDDIFNTNNSPNIEKKVFNDDKLKTTPVVVVADYDPRSPSSGIIR
jgi:hypothetical protein